MVGPRVALLLGLAAADGTYGCWKPQLMPPAPGLRIRVREFHIPSAQSRPIEEIMMRLRIGRQHDQRPVGHDQGRGRRAQRAGLRHPAARWLGRMPHNTGDENDTGQERPG